MWVVVFADKLILEGSGADSKFNRMDGGGKKKSAVKNPPQLFFLEQP